MMQSGCKGLTIHIMHDKYNLNERHDEAIITQSKLRPNATPTKIWLAELQIAVYQ